MRHSEGKDHTTATLKARNPELLNKSLPSAAVRVGGSCEEAASAADVEDGPTWTCLKFEGGSYCRPFGCLLVGSCKYLLCFYTSSCYQNVVEHTQTKIRLFLTLQSAQSAVIKKAFKGTEPPSRAAAIVPDTTMLLRGVGPGGGTEEA